MRRPWRHRRRRGANRSLIVIALTLAVVVIAAVSERGVPSLSLAPGEAKPKLPDVIRFQSGSAAITVIDGDTVRHDGRVVRLVGFDAAETGNRARCERERRLADQATARLRALVASSGSAAVLNKVRCSCPPGTEGTQTCNFGRACGVLTINGRDVGAILIGEGLARGYVCGATSCPPRSSWC